MAKLNWKGFKVPKSKAKLISNASHSYDVHFGGVSRTDGTKTPARPFMEAAIPETDFEGKFKEEYDRSESLEMAFEFTTNALHEEIRNQITSEIWQWDRATYRKNGSVVGSPRDIVDTGELLESQSIEISHNG